MATTAEGQAKLDKMIASGMGRQQSLNMLIKAQKAAQPTPNNMPAKDPLAGMSTTSRSLYEDPTPAFQSALNFIEQQRTQANERYAQNKADIANIFGQLTQVNQDSQARVNKQFTESIANQQMATAQRVAEARLGAQQTQESAIKAMDERGGGPVGNLAASPVAVEAERGIGRQNALQALFAGQQGAIQQQTIQDLVAAQQGYGAQRLGAEAGLGRSLEDVLLGLSGQEAGVRGDLAAAKLAGRQTVREANYNELMAKAAQDANLRAAQAGAANRPKSYSSGITGIIERISDQAGPSSATAFSQSIADIMSGAGSASGVGKATAPTSISDALARWIKANPKTAAAYQGYAADAFSEIFSKTIVNPNRSGSSTGTQRPTLEDYFTNG